MNSGTFTEFRDALRAFESGWDRERYNAGVIQDQQLDQWAGGAVQTIFPNYSSWSQLSDAEWETMSYRSTNTLGFVGYQFGEALLIDLGYYDDDVFYGNGAATNTWDGTWTGKNGVTSLDQFKTKAAQEIAIQEAFGHNLKIIQDGLGNSGQSLDDFVGTTRTYMQNGQPVEVELTLTGIMAAAHLRGAFGTLALLQGGSVSSDEFGTSILRYIEQFGGYEAPSAAESIAFFTSRLTGDEGLGTPGGTPTPGDGGSGGSGTAGVTKDDADAVVTWAWGKQQTIDNFDPTKGTVFIDWINAEQLEVSETAAGVVFSVPSNGGQTLTLAGIKLTDLTPANFTILDQSAATEVFALIGKGQPDDTGDPDGGDPNGGDPDGDEPGDGDHDDDHGGAAQMVMIGPNSPSRTIDAFDASKDMVHLEAGITGDRFEIFEESGDALGLTVRIAITDANGVLTSTTILRGVGLKDLTLANFSVAEQTALNEVVTAINATVTPPVPGSGGYTVTYDSDGSNPPQITGAATAGGNKYRTDVNADDIVGFDPTRDELDFGGISVHGLILTKTPAGEIAVDSPWSNAMQIVTGVSYQDIALKNLGIVGNEHLREDAGAVLSWELGVGPRDADTVYIRSHEYGSHQVINDFDPSTMKISFLYFGTRERLSVRDTSEGLVISSLPTGQSFAFTDVKLAQLAPGRVEFHFDQVHEDNLETPFGFAQDDVTLVDRTVLLTPTAPAGESTDGFQTRTGSMTPRGVQPGDGDTDDPDVPAPVPDVGSGGGTAGVTKATADVVVTWNWGADTRVPDFDPATDTIFIDWVGADFLEVTQSGANTVFAIPSNQQTITLENVALSDLSAGNFTILDQSAATEVLNLVGPSSPTPAPDDGGDPDPGTDPAPDPVPDPNPTPDPDPMPDPGTGGTPKGVGQVDIAWNWAAQEIIEGFDPAKDQIDFGSMAANQIAISEQGDDLVVEVLNNGGHTYRLTDIQAEDLKAENLTADGYNPVVSTSGGIVDQLTPLGYDDLLV